MEEDEITDELQERVERGYMKWCVEVGVPQEKLEGKRRFWTLLKWVSEKPEIRERLVKTGWKSWHTKWRDKAFKTRPKKGKVRRKNNKTSTAFSFLYIVISFSATSRETLSFDSDYPGGLQYVALTI